MVARTDDPFLGMRLGTAVSVREYGIVGYTLSHSDTLGQALGRLLRYMHIINEGVELVLDVSGSLVDVAMRGRQSFHGLHHPADFGLSVLLAACRELAGADLTPASVRFPYPRPADTSGHAAHFPCPLSFGHEEAGFTLPVADVERPIRSADPDLMRYLDRVAEEILLELEQPRSFVDEVKRAVWLGLSQGRVQLGDAARALGVSTRTLQRRLKEEGTTFAGCLESLRHDMALGLLRSKALAVSEVAYLLGYAEPSTFHRAFRRWTGTSPRAFRAAGD
jgi:AraC-like DNA-binding protein